MTVRCAIIDTEEQVVVNVIEYDEVPEGAPHGFDGPFIAVADERASPGWGWDGLQTVDTTPQLGPAPVPTITKAQALLYLLSIGKTEADVKAVIATISDPTAHAVAEIEWNYRQPFHYDHPLFAALGPLLGISDIAAAFRIAATL